MPKYCDIRHQPLWKCYEMSKDYTLHLQFINSSFINSPLFSSSFKCAEEHFFGPQAIQLKSTCIGIWY